MKQKAFSEISKLALISAVSLGSLVGCQAPVRSSSNLGVSNGDAQTNLDIRLRESKDIKRKLIRISDALKPLNEILSTLTDSLRRNTSQLQLNVDGRPLDQLTDGSLEDLEWARRLLKLLQRASEGLVDHRADGGWTLSREIHDLTFRNAATGAVCSDSKIVLEGGRSSRVDRFTVSIEDCANPAPRILGSAEVSNGEIRFEFHPLSVDQNLNRQVTLGSAANCVLAMHSSDSSVICRDPIVTAMGNFKVQIDALELYQTGLGTRGSFRALVLNRETGREAGHFEVQALPGQPANFSLRLP